MNQESYKALFIRADDRGHEAPGVSEDPYDAFQSAPSQDVNDVRENLGEAFGTKGVRNSAYVCANTGDGGTPPVTEICLKARDRRSSRRLVKLLTERGDWVPGLSLLIEDDGTLALVVPAAEGMRLCRLLGRGHVQI